MTPGQWDACDDPERLLRFLGSDASRRKLRLFACACVRRVPEWISDKHVRQVLRFNELYADGRIGSRKLVRAMLRLSTAAALIGQRWSGRDRELALPVARRALLAHAESTTERAAQAALLRDVFNPFLGEVATDPRSLGNRAEWGALASAIYEAGAYDRLPILGDALEEAGCSDARLLGHCRSGAGHVRGCWVVDWFLRTE